MPKRDYRSGPFRTLVILGESTVKGRAWLADGERRYADILVEMINRCQEDPIEYYNEGISASVVSPRSPGYEASAKPSAMERYRTRVIEASPDLFILAYGLNDMRSGMPVGEFAEDMGKIVGDVRAVCNPVIVLTTVYHMTGWDRYPPFDRGSREATIEYNQAIARVASENDCLLADVWTGQGEADWLVHNDGVHANSVGMTVIAGRIFETLAGSCSCLSRETNARHANSEWSRAAAGMAYRNIEPAK